MGGNSTWGEESGSFCATWSAEPVFLCTSVSPIRGDSGHPALPPGSVSSLGSWSPQGGAQPHHCSLRRLSVPPQRESDGESLTCGTAQR